MDHPVQPRQEGKPGLRHRGQPARGGGDRHRRLGAAHGPRQGTRRVQVPPRPGGQGQGGRDGGRRGGCWVRNED